MTQIWKGKIAGLPRARKIKICPTILSIVYLLVMAPFRILSLELVVVGAISTLGGSLANIQIWGPNLLTLFLPNKRSPNVERGGEGI